MLVHSLYKTFLLLKRARGVLAEQWGQSRESEEQVYTRQDFPGGAVFKNPPANAGDTGSSPGPGISHMLRSN